MDPDIWMKLKQDTITRPTGNHANRYPHAISCHHLPAQWSSIHSCTEVTITDKQNGNKEMAKLTQAFQKSGFTRDKYIQHPTAYHIPKLKT